MKIQYGMIAVLVVVSGVVIWQLSEKFTSNTSMPKSTSPRPTSSVDQPPKMSVDQKKIYTAILHTDKGDITVSLHVKETPATVNNFVYLSKKGFYDNTIFHRVIAGFMIQGGDPNGNGTGGPGYRFNDEPITGTYTRGTMAMANSGPNTNGSQFFIMHADYDLPKNYVIFGSVTDGMGVVDTIATASVHAGSSGEDSTPDSPVHIKSIDIQVK